MYANVRGIKGKITGLITVLEDIQPHVFLLTETHLQADTGINIPNYTFHGRKREGKPGGGVGILVRNDIRIFTAVHKSTRNIEMLWLSIRRKNKPPLMLGTYYGKQECRNSKEEIEKEMTILQEEIIEMSHEGEIIIAMDGNAKIGILDEEVSRNGKLLLKAMEDTDLEIMNCDPICQGKVTRQNTQNIDEISAIDFIVASSNASEWIKSMLIDEEGLYKIKGKNETDHNTIHVNISIPDIDKIKKEKFTTWNLHAPEEKWNEFAIELEKSQNAALDIIQDKSIPFETRYKKFTDIIDKASKKEKRRKCQKQ